MLLKRKITLGLVGSALGVLILAACAPVTFLNGITPSSSFSKAKNISYGDLDRQALDIYKADNSRADAPVIVFIHGGSWSEGNKDIYKFLAEGFTSEGFDIVVPNYRLYPEAVYPQMIEDTAKAIAFVSKQYPDRPLVLMGHSAGGYNMLMASLNKNYLTAEGVSVCERVSGLVSLAAPVGVEPLVREPYITIFPDRFQKDDAPIAYTEQPSPAVLVIHGTEDTTVNPKNANDLAAKIQARGGQAVLKVYEGLDHTDAVKLLSRHFDDDAPLKSDIISFVNSLPRTGNFCK